MAVVGLVFNFYYLFIYFKGFFGFYWIYLLAFCFLHLNDKMVKCFKSIRFEYKVGFFLLSLERTFERIFSSQVRCSVLNDYRFT